MRLRTRLLGVTLIPLVLLLGALTASWAVYQKKHLFRYREETCVQTARMLQRVFLNIFIYQELRLIAEGGLIDAYIETVASDPHLECRYVMILDPSGRILYHNDLKQCGRVLEDSLSQAVVAGRDLLEQQLILDHERILDVSLPLAVGTKSWGHLRLGFSLAPVERDLRDYLILSVVTSGLVMLLLSVLLVLFTGRVARPLGDLALALQEYTPGAAVHLDLQSPGTEERILEQRFMEMAQRLNQLEENRLRALDRSKMEDLGLQSAEIAHSLKNPLGTLKNTFRWLARHDLPPDQRDRYTAVAGDAIRALVERIDVLLHPDPAGETGIPPDQILGSAVEMARLQFPGVAIAVPPAPPRIALLGHRLRLQSILAAVLTNACEANNGKGEILLQAEEREGMLRVRVSDQGPGMPAHVLRNLGAPYLTTKPNGSGLGLCLSIHALRTLGGELSVHAPAGGGCCVTMDLPCRRS